MGSGSSKQTFSFFEKKQIAIFSLEYLQTCLSIMERHFPLLSHLSLQDLKMLRLVCKPLLLQLAMIFEQRAQMFAPLAYVDSYLAVTRQFMLVGFKPKHLDVLSVPIEDLGLQVVGPALPDNLIAACGQVLFGDTPRILNGTSTIPLFWPELLLFTIDPRNVANRFLILRCIVVWVRYNIDFGHVNRIFIPFAPSDLHEPGFRTFYLELLQLLPLKKDVEVVFKLWDGKIYTPLHVLLLLDESYEILLQQETFFAKYVNVATCRLMYWTTPVHLAITLNLLQQTEWLIYHGATIRNHDHRGDNLFMLAIRNNNMFIADALLKWNKTRVSPVGMKADDPTWFMAGFDPYHKNKEGESAGDIYIKHHGHQPLFGFFFHLMRYMIGQRI